jgi:glycosyltransferase involved in cell wall biosynthesis
MASLDQFLGSRQVVAGWLFAGQDNSTNHQASIEATKWAERPSITVIVPAYNEENGIRPQVNAIEQVLQMADIVHEIIVVDDGSADRTAEEALMTSARVLQHQENRGYGAAIKTGIVAAAHDIIVIIDADGTYPAEQILVIVEKLAVADMVVGARIGSNVQIPWARRPAKWMLGWLATRIADQAIPDLNSGLRAFRRSCIKQYFPILSNRFSFTTTSTLCLLADDYRVVYHPINYYQRVGRSKITPRHFMDFMILILRVAMLFQPLKIFVPLAFLFGSLGVLKVIYDVATLFLRYEAFNIALLYQPTISGSAILLLLVGIQLLLIGMMADGVVRRIGQNNRFQAPSHAIWGIELRADSQDKMCGTIAGTQ